MSYRDGRRYSRDDRQGDRRDRGHDRRGDDRRSSRVEHAQEDHGKDAFGRDRVRDTDYRRYSRSRSRSPGRHERRREREREREKERVPRDREHVRHQDGRVVQAEKTGEYNSTKPVIEKNTFKDEDSKDTTEEGEVMETAAVDEDDPEAMMAAMMGFGSFGSTKGKQHAEVGAADVKKPRVYRQYMNRLGGFNRPLDKLKE